MSAEQIANEKAAAHLADAVMMRDQRRAKLVLIGLFVGVVAFCTFSGFEQAFWAEARSAVLHAVPEKELNLINLTTSDEAFSSMALGAGKKVLFGKPAEPLDHPVDFVPPSAFQRATGKIVALPPSLPPSPLAPPPHAAPPSPKPWIEDAKLAPRAANASKAAKAAAFEVLDVRPGTLLIGGNGFSEEEAMYNGAVVLLMRVCGCHPSIFGLILNRPANQTMADHFCPRSTAAYPALVNSTAYLGGPVGPYWSVLSPRPTSHSYSPTAGVHVVGSLGETHQQVVDGALSADDVRFFSGYAAWPISRLEEEVAQGKWKVAKASEALLLSGLRGGDLAARLAVAMQ